MAEKRPGLVQLGNTVAGSAQITGIHEYISRTGDAILYVASSDNIYRFSYVSAFTTAYSFDLATFTTAAQARVESVQMGDRLIFANVHVPLAKNNVSFTVDGTAFSTLLPVVEKGDATASTSAAALRDTDVANWVTTNVRVNDLVYYPDLNAYAVITAVTTAELTHTAINSAAAATGLGGLGTRAPTTGDRYMVLDTVENNIIPFRTGDPSFGLDNVATLGTGSGTATVAVSGVTFDLTNVLIGDFVYNTTRSAVVLCSTFATNIVCTSAAGQVPGDSVVFLKLARPCARNMHVHNGRLYINDRRDRQKVRISGRNDPEDFTSDSDTLDSITFDAGGVTPIGDKIIRMVTWQRFLVVGGRRQIIIMDGLEPIPTSAANTSVDFRPVGVLDATEENAHFDLSGKFKRIFIWSTYLKVVQMFVVGSN